MFTLASALSVASHANTNPELWHRFEEVEQLLRQFKAGPVKSKDAKRRNYNKSDDLQAHAMRRLMTAKLGSLTVKELATALGVSDSVARYHLRKLEDAGRIVLLQEPHRGRYRLRAVIVV